MKADKIIKNAKIFTSKDCLDFRQIISQRIFNELT